MTKDKKKILLVEDEAIHLMYLNVMLQSHGFEISGLAANADIALKSIEKNCPDIVILDINLGNSIDGIDLALIIREKFDFPIIFVSGFDDSTTSRRRIDITNSTALSKPVAESKLVEKINEFLNDRS